MPIESARSTRVLSDRGHYKANEWRNLAFYLVIPLFKSYMHEKYFNNLIKYVVYIRILCQDKISAEDLKDAELIFIDFIREYEILYGIDNMTSNLHAHFHLIAQVKRFGPLTKCSGFAFENMFRLTREMYHGTVNFEGQIGRNLIRNQTIQYETIHLDSKLNMPKVPVAPFQYMTKHFNPRLNISIRDYRFQRLPL